MIDDLDRYRYAQRLFEQRRYGQAARELEGLLDGGDGHGTADACLLLARSYFHSAQLGRAEQAARALIESDPTDGYAHVLLGRTLERLSRHDEAGQYRRLAEALGERNW